MQAGGVTPTLDRLVQPRSIAIVGASGRPGNPVARPLEHLHAHGWPRAGFRGGAVHDRAAAVGAIAGRCRLSLALGPRLVEVEANPFIVQPEGGGVVAADALVRIHPEPGADNQGGVHA